MSRSTHTAVDEKLEQLRAKGTPHAIATVVRTLSSTAAKPGMKAIILEDGEFAKGWLGGGCVTSAVRRAARLAIASGEATLVCLRPEELLDEANNEVMVTLARNGCPSKGSMDIFVEPVLPLPELVVFGEGPVAFALAQISGWFGFTLTLCSKIKPVELKLDCYFSSPNELANSANKSIDRYVVVATQGAGDVAALKSALSGSAAYMAFVGSKKKFASYVKKLLAAGISKECLDKVYSPAGLNINALTPEEIALSIMAEIVKVRRAKGGREGTDD